MPTLPPSTPPVNELPTTTTATVETGSEETPFLPEDALFVVRIAVVEGHAMAVAVADALADLPPSPEVERIQALANICQRTCHQALEELERLTAK